LSKKVFKSEKAIVYNFHLECVRANYPYLTLREAITLASLNTVIDGYPGPVIGSETDINWVLTKVKIREMPAEVQSMKDEISQEKLVDQHLGLAWRLHQFHESDSEGDIPPK